MGAPQPTQFAALQRVAELEAELAHLRAALAKERAQGSRPTAPRHAGERRLWLLAAALVTLGCLCLAAAVYLPS